MKKTRSSTKIAIGFVVVVAAAYFGYGFVSGFMVDRIAFAELKPGTVNIVGVDTSAGYYIIVANEVAQLVRGSSGEFEAADHEVATETEKKRVPIRELLQSLQGDERALGKFVMAMNDISDKEYPANPKIWRAEDVRSAVAEVGPLRARLEKDLSVRLDGTPAAQISAAALSDGILIDSPVEVELQVGPERRQLTARVLEQYIPRLCRTVWAKLSEKSTLTPEIIAGYYREEAQKLLAGTSERENVSQALLSRMSDERLEELSKIPEKVLDSVEVVLNDSLIVNASYRSYKSGDGKPMHDLVLNVSDEGRKRLWQFSRKHPNAQLLVTWEGIAIAAPRIKGELALSEVVVNQLMDEGLVKDTVEALKSVKRE